MPLFSLLIFTVGNGLFGTLLALRLHLAGYGATTIGSMTSAYYLGLVLGSFRIEPLISKIGHIRAFAAFSSLLAVMSILQGIFIIPWLWLVLRLIGGVATAGIFVVIESWLLVMSNKNNRGQILALYMIVYFAGQAAGQLLLDLGSTKSLLLFAITAMTCSLAVIPLTLFQSKAPEIEPPSILNFRQLYNYTASGMVGCFIAGLIISAIYGLLPLFLIKTPSTQTHLPIFMSVILLGGLCLQYPIGKWSDIIDRRNVIIIIMLLTIITSFVLGFVSTDKWFIGVMLFIFGGLIFTLYPVAMSYACDNLPDKNIVAGTQALLFAYSIGATIGPFAAAGFMHLYDPSGLFVFFIIISLPTIAFVIWRKIRKDPKPSDEAFAVVPQTTPVVSELDPRTD